MAYAGISPVRYTSYEPYIPLIPAQQRAISVHVQYTQKQVVNFVNIHEKISIINFKKVLQNRAFSYILIHVVTLIAMKREVATQRAWVFRGANVKLANWRQVTVQVKSPLKIKGKSCEYLRDTHG